MNKKLVFVFGVIFFFTVIGLGVFLSGSISSGAGHKIVLTQDGFVPDELTIKKGDTVTFEGKLGKHYWPASDLHPTHEIYSEFDPKNPVEPDKTWSFTFRKTGEWNYHDHLAPYFTGKITVVE